MQRVPFYKRIDLRKIDISNEYLKIRNFIETTFTRYGINIFDEMDSIYKYYEPVNLEFTDLKLLKDYFDQRFIEIVNSYLEDSDEYKKEILFFYLDFCEVVLDLLRLIIEKLVYNDLDIIKQCIGIVEKSLELLGYEKTIKDEHFVIYKSNVLVETIIDNSNDDISNLIIDYLSSRDYVEIKEKNLLNLITLIDSDRKKISKIEPNGLISKSGEFFQLLRHKSEKINQPEYNWFFNNESKYLDSIFQMCLLILETKIVMPLISQMKTNMKTK